MHRNGEESELCRICRSEIEKIRIRFQNRPPLAPAGEEPIGSKLTFAGGFKPRDPTLKTYFMEITVFDNRKQISHCPYISGVCEVSVKHRELIASSERLTTSFYLNRMFIQILILLNHTSDEERTAP